MNPKLGATLKGQDWPNIFVKLTAHASFRMTMFGLRGETRMQGKQPKDFAQEAITLLYEEKRHWDPLKEPDLTKYLKTVINSLIANLLKSTERLLNAEMPDEMDDSLFFETMLEEQLIHKDFIEVIEGTMLNDANKWLVFTDLALGMTPQDISDKYDMDIELIRNVQKQLRRHIKKLNIL